MDFNLKELVREYGFNLSANGSLDIKRYLVTQSILRGEASDLLGTPESGLLREIDNLKNVHNLQKQALIDAIRKI